LQSGRDGGGMSVDESGAVPDDDVTRAPSAPTGSTDPGPWAVAMADLTVELHASFTDLDATIAAVAASAVKILPGVTAAGVVRIGKDGVLTCQTASNHASPADGAGRAPDRAGALPARSRSG